jgi:hypothetical protein
MSDERGANPTQLVVFPIDHPTMSDQQTTDKATTNGYKTTNPAPTRRRKQWKDLPPDPLSEGYTEHPASYTVGSSPVTWNQLQVGQMFCRTKSGKAVHVKVNAGRAVCLDTQAPMEVKPTIRATLQVWLVTGMNTTTATTAEKAS